MEIALNSLQFAKWLFQNHSLFREESLAEKYVPFSPLDALISKLKPPLFSVKLVGKSVLGKNIRSITFGNGDKKILLWSQMHGDESTATRAMFDVLNFFMKSPEESQKILEKTTICFVPMVNPDGAELYTRRNIQRIDINRDFLSLQTPEGRALLSAFEQFQPDFSFNLHDQETKYSAGYADKPAVISFLAPPFNRRNEIHAPRAKAMKLIAELNESISQFVPECVGRYADEFEPRAFGDNFAKLGSSVILIESGGWKGESNKEFQRKLNFISLLVAVRSIAWNSFENYSTEQYESIPENIERMHDLIIRNCTVFKNGISALCDIAVKREEKFDQSTKELKIKSCISDIGDLSTDFAYEEFDAGRSILAGDISVDSPADFELHKNKRLFARVENGFLISVEK